MARSVVFQADTSKFTAPVERSATVVRDLSRAFKEQEKAARDAFREQINNAKAAGASETELTAIEQQRYRSLIALQAAQKQLAAETVSNGKAAVDSAEARAEAENLVTAAYKEQLAAVNATFGAIKKQHAEVAGSIAGGAAIRTLDGGQNVRAVENFLAKTLGLGGALQALFPLIGGVAFVQLLVEGGQKLYELTQRAHEAHDALVRAMEDAHAKTQVTIDDLTIQADKLQLNIDKLEGTPRNGMKLAIDEAKKSADELLTQLIADRKELEGILKDTHVGPLQAFASNTNPTSATEKDILSRSADISKAIDAADRDYNAKAAKAGSLDELKSLGDARDQVVRKIYSDAIDSVNGELKDKNKGNAGYKMTDSRTGRTYTSGAGANQNEIDQLNYFRDQITGRRDLLEGQANVAALTARYQKDLDNKPEGGSTTNKAAEEQRKQWETDLKQQQAQGDMTLAQEREFWLARVQVVQAGSENWRVAYDKYLDVSKKMIEDARKQAADLRRINDEWGKAGLSDLLKIISPGAVAQSRGIAAGSSSARSLAEAQSNAGYSLAEQDINFQRQTKQITAYDAAMQLQTLHTRQYEEQLGRLNEQLSAVDNTDPNAEAQRNAIRQQITGLNQGRSAQVNQDAIATGGGYTSGAVGARDALDEFVRATRDAASQMRNIVESIIGGVNNNLSAAIVGDRTDWSGTFRGIGRQVANYGLQQAEGSLLGAFGLGKPDGSSSNPLYVRIADGTGSVTSGFGGVIKNLFGGGDDSDDSGGGGLLSAIFGGFRANGGSVQAGKSYVTGERGIELFTPGVSGTITPNSALLGGGDTHNWSIDARGATDPTAVEQAVARGIAAATPHIIRGSVAAVSESSRRKPLSAQR